MKSIIQIRIGMWSSIVVMILLSLMSIQGDGVDVITLLLCVGLFGGFALSVKFRKFKTSLILWLLIGILPTNGAWTRHGADCYFVFQCIFILIILLLLSQAIRGVYKELRYTVDESMDVCIVGIVSGFFFFFTGDSIFPTANHLVSILPVIYGIIGGCLVYAVIRWIILGFIPIEEIHFQEAKQSDIPVISEIINKNEMSNQFMKSVKCLGCNKALSKFQAENIGKPEYTEWFRKGYCSLECFEKNHIQEK